MEKIISQKYMCGSYSVLETNSLSTSETTKKMFKKHQITTQLGIFIPKQSIDDVSNIKKLVEELFYYTATIPFSFVLNKDFLEEYIKSSNSFLLYSINTPTPPCNSVYLVNGIMYLYVDKDSYQTIGLDGTKINDYYYVIIINLKHLTNSFYERLLFCLSDSRMLPITVVMSFTSKENGKSLVINIPPNFQPKQIYNAFLVTEYNSIQIPNYENINFQLDNNKSMKLQESEIKNLNNLIDYIGMIECNIDDILDGNEKDNYISSFSPLSGYISDCDDAIHVKCVGEFSYIFIQSLMKILSGIIKFKHLSYFIFSVYGLNSDICLKQLHSQYIKKEEEIEDKNIHLILFENDKSIIFCV